MFRRYVMTDREKCELEEYRGTGLTPAEIREIKKKLKEVKK